MMLKTLIVDDEQASRTTLRNFLQAYCPQVKVLGEAANIAEAKVQIETHVPDLVFLDVEMPYGNGFDLLESMETVGFKVVFVTAFSHYALRAIQYSAAHYILKPVDIDELIEAVKRVTEEADTYPDSTQVLLANIKTTQKQKTKVVLPIINGFEVVEAEEIVFCQAEENFTRFYLESGREVLICRTLKYYQEVLEPLDFLRIHKSYLINLHHVRKYRKGRGGDVTMANGMELPVSPAQKDELMRYYMGS
ncbi:MAG: LytTR family DNA-binding domain-containing protein [Cytophagales bacterium]|nr:LytTR family DNA-binding domain-containing protein [Cytophagales bacterium]